MEMLPYPSPRAWLSGPEVGEEMGKKSREGVQVSLLASILGLKGFRHLALLEFHVKTSKLQSPSQKRYRDVVLGRTQCPSGSNQK